MAREVVWVTFTSPQPLFDESGAAVLKKGTHVVGPVTKTAFRSNFELAEAEVRGWLRITPESEATMQLVTVTELENGTVDPKTMKVVAGNAGRKLSMTRQEVLDAAE